MKIVSFNINSVRARPHQLEHIRDHLNPDVIGLQETKVHDDEFPIELINEIGYHCEFWGQKGHYGVALLSKEKPLDAVKGFIKDTSEDQKRFIQGQYGYKGESIFILNGYFPQGENRSHESKFPKKIKYYKDLKTHIKKLQKVNQNIIKAKHYGGKLKVVPGALREAITFAIKEWSNNPDYYYLIGSTCSSSPFVDIVRYAQSIIGKEMREQFIELEGKLPNEIIACAGAGSNFSGSGLARS